MSKSSSANLFSPFPELITNRLELRQLEPADAREIYLLRTDERVNMYIIRARPETMEDGLRFIHKINVGISHGEWIYWAIVPKGQETLVGTICVWNWDKGTNHAELGYELMPEFQGKGFMLEALHRVLEYAFDSMKLKRIEAWMHPDNLRSVHLLQKNHFTQDTTHVAATAENMIVYFLEKS